MPTDDELIQMEEPPVKGQKDADTMDRCKRNKFLALLRDGSTHCFQRGPCSRRHPELKCASTRHTNDAVLLCIPRVSQRAQYPLIKEIQPKS